mmetsp:Transcript_8043/g.19396  ORF Transcript_8043/g.19396 Transcript_8043/m.19396 type:complete len:343 (-) Transcript_8043:2589-3617(-)
MQKKFEFYQRSADLIGLRLSVLRPRQCRFCSRPLGNILLVHLLVLERLGLLLYGLKVVEAGGLLFVQIRVHPVGRRPFEHVGFEFLEVGAVLGVVEDGLEEQKEVLRVVRVRLVLLTPFDDQVERHVVAALAFSVRAAGGEFVAEDHKQTDVRGVQVCVQKRAPGRADLVVELLQLVEVVHRFRGGLGHELLVPGGSHGEKLRKRLHLVVPQHREDVLDHGPEDLGGGALLPVRAPAVRHEGKQVQKRLFLQVPVPRRVVPDDSVLVFVGRDPFFQEEVEHLSLVQHSLHCVEHLLFRGLVERPPVLGGNHVLGLGTAMGIRVPLPSAELVVQVRSPRGTPP